MQHSEYDPRDERWLVTGSLGCIGAWSVRNLRDSGADMVALDIGDDTSRLRLALEDEAVDGIKTVRGDVTDLDLLCQVVTDFRITHIIHLAALQLPSCAADPPRGAAVNVVGTLNVFEAAARSKTVRAISYASSMAVFDISAASPVTLLVEPDAHPEPTNHYGVFKCANEAGASIYHRSHGIVSRGVRPYVVFGPGRDFGMTSAPSLAVLAAVVGVPYEVPFVGGFQLQYARDVAAAFIAAARSAREGARTIAIPGPVVTVAEFLDHLALRFPDARDTITSRGSPLPFPRGALPSHDFDSLAIAIAGVDQAIADTARIFESARSRGGLEEYAQRVLGLPTPVRS